MVKLLQRAVAHPGRSQALFRLDQNQIELLAQAVPPTFQAETESKKQKNWEGTLPFSGKELHKTLLANQTTSADEFEFVSNGIPVSAFRDSSRQLYLLQWESFSVWSELDLILRNSEESFVFVNKELQIVCFNEPFKKATENLLHKTPRRGDSILSLAQPERHELVKQMYKSVFEGNAQQSELSYPDETGKLLTYSIRFKPARNANGEVLGAFVSTIDISEIKEALRQVELNEKRFRAYVEHGGDTVAVFNADMETTYISPSIVNTLGYSEQEAAQLDLGTVVHPDDLADVSKILEKSLNNPGKPLPGYTSRLKHKDGTWRWFDAVVTNLLHDPDVNGIIDNFRDVTDRVVQEQAVSNLNKLLHNVLDSISDGFYTLNQRDEVVFWNPGAEKLLGLSLDEVRGKTIWELYPDSVTTPFFTGFQLARETGSMQEIEAFYPPHNRWYEIVLYPSRENMSVLVRDIQDRKQAEQHLQELNLKLIEQTHELRISNQELEQFAYVASHDLQEPLRMVTGFLAQIERRYNHLLDEKGKTYIDYAVNGAKRMRQLITDLLEYSRAGRVKEQRIEVNLTDLIEEIGVNFEPTIQELGGKIHVKQPLASIHAQPTALKVALTNLVSNALKYHKEGVAPYIEISTTTSGNTVNIHVKDNGIGIEKEYFQRIFIIFQRLHGIEEYPGTGLGLAIAKKVCESHGGWISVESTPGEGSTFTLTLPINSQQP